MKNKKISIFIVSILMFSLMISGCAAKQHESMDVAPQENSAARPPADMDYGEDSVSSDEWAEEHGYDMVEPDKIITTVNISMQTKEFTETTDKLMDLISKHKGYIENFKGYKGNSNREWILWSYRKGGNNWEYKFRDIKR